MPPLFWWYLLVSFLAGMVWIPFVQLSSTIIKHRFATPDSAIDDMKAAEYASVILFNALEAGALSFNCTNGVCFLTALRVSLSSPVCIQSERELESDLIAVLVTFKVRSNG